MADYEILSIHRNTFCVERYRSFFFFFLVLNVTKKIKKKFFVIFGIPSIYKEQQTIFTGHSLQFNRCNIMKLKKELGMNLT